MANRFFNQFRFSLEKNVVDLYARLTFSSGTATLARGKGITSVASPGSGVYNFVFQDKYNAFLGMAAMMKDATTPGADIPLGAHCYITAVDAAAGTLSIQFTDHANIASVPGDSETVYLTFTFSNSSAI